MWQGDGRQRGRGTQARTVALVMTHSGLLAQLMRQRMRYGCVPSRDDSVRARIAWQRLTVIVRMLLQRKLTITITQIAYVGKHKYRDLRAHLGQGMLAISVGMLLQCTGREPTTAQIQIRTGRVQVVVGCLCPASAQRNSSTRPNAVMLHIIGPAMSLTLHMQPIAHHQQLSAQTLEPLLQVHSLIGG